MMEKGLPGPVHAQILDEKVRQIALPSQLPKGIDFSDIPLNAIRSATVEGLISQNEDLMARLTISLRKIHELEQSAEAHAQEQKSLHTRFQTLREQFLILEAKDRTTISRSLHQQEENLILKREGVRIEKLYADLYAQAQALKTKVVRLERYRSRILRVGKPMQKKLKRLRILEAEIVQFRRSLGAHKIALQEEFDARSAALDTRAKEIEREHRRELDAVNSKLSEAMSRADALQAKADERDRIYEDLLKSENLRVFDQRRHEQTQAETEKTSARLELEATSLRQQLKDLLVDRESKIQELARLTAEIPELTERNRALIEQVESLQSLWTFKQREMEQAEEKNRSLQKLNQSLSQTLNQQRKEIQQLLADRDQDRMGFEDKLKTLTTEIQMLRAQVSASAPSGGTEETERAKL